MAIIGSAYVNIRAITDKLESDIERALAGIKDTITIKVDADTSQARAKIDELQNSLADDIFIPVFVETTHAEQTVEDFVDKSSRKNINIPVDATTMAANRQISWAARPRFVEIFARLNKASWTKLSTQIAAMTGVRVIANYFDDLSQAISNMDKNAVKVTTLTVSITTLIATITAGLGGAITVINDLFKVLGLLVIAPGILAGFAAGAITSYLALKDMGTVLKDLGPAFKALQDQISADFWAEAEKPIRDMVDRLLPELEAGFALTSKATGSFFGEFATQIANAFDDGVFVEMMRNVADSTDIAKGSLADMADSTAILGRVGSAYLPRLSKWWVEINNDFNNFLTRAEADGTLVKWADDSIEATKLVGRSIWAIGEMFYEIDRAATAAGGGGLLRLTENLEHFADLLGSEKVQTTMTQLFRGSNDAMTSVAAGIGRLGAGVAVIGPALETSLRTAGSAFGMLLTGIGTAISNPAFGTGLTSMFDGFHGAIQAVFPAMDALGEKFGHFMSLIGTVAASIGRVLGPAITALAPLAEPVFTIIGTLFTQLSTVMANLITAVAPAIETLSSWLQSLSEKLAGVNPMFTAMGAAAVALIPIIVGIVGSIASFAASTAPLLASLGGVSGIMATLGSAARVLLGPIGLTVAAFATMYATSEEFRGAINGVLGSIMGLVSSLVGALLPPLMSLVQSVMPVLVSVFTTVASVIGQVLTAITPLINLIGTMLVPMLGQLAAGILPLVATVFQTVATAVMSVVNAIMPVITSIIPLLIPLITTLVSALQPIITALIGVFTAVMPVVNALIGQLVPIFNELATTVFPMVVQVIGLLTTAINTIVAAVLPVIATILSSLIPVLTSVLIPAFEFLGTTIKVVFDAIIPVVQGVLQIIIGAIQVFSGILTGNWSQIWEGLKNIVGGAFNTIISAISGAVRIILGVVGSLAQNIVQAISGIVSNMWQVGVDIMNGLKDGLLSMVGNLIDIAANAGRAILDGIKGVLGIKSPSRVFRDEVGVQIGNGLAEGLRRSENVVAKAATRLAEAAIPDIKPMSTSMTVDTFQRYSSSSNAVPTSIPTTDVQSVPRASSGYLGNEMSRAPISINVHPKENMSEEEIGRAAAHELYWQYINR